MDEQQKNLLTATALCFLVLIGWAILQPPAEQAPEVEPVSEQIQPEIELALENKRAEAADRLILSGEDKELTLASPRIPIEGARVSGSIRLIGGRIDDLVLKDYKVSLAADAPNVSLLKPGAELGAYYADFGWATGGVLSHKDVPGENTPWHLISGTVLSENQPVTLEWVSPAGLIFWRKIALDENYMFTITDEVKNTRADAVILAPYGQITRQGEPEDLKGFFILHEGAIVQTGDEINELKYKRIRKLDSDPTWGQHASVVKSTANSWIGFTDHYWMTTLIPNADASTTSVLKYDAPRDQYRTTTRLAKIDLPPNSSEQATLRFFAGAKEWATIRAYERDLGIYRFVDSIDWGWFFFLTKYMFQILHWFNLQIGNMGWAIIALTLVIKAALFPLAYKSYVSMARMKELQPEIQKLKDSCGDDRQRLQKEMMELYRKKKVNPAAGCLPLLLQIPIFFSLYKVIFVTIELRHAPWFGWIRDLSAPDPSSLMNLWGLLPWQGPEPGTILALLFIGILPLLLGVSMWLQQKLNPAPTEPAQAMIFAWMPWVFMFMLGSFASGLVVYWIANNVITFIQQYVIMRSTGYKPDVFGNILSSLKPKKGKEDK